MKWQITGILIRHISGSKREKLTVNEIAEGEFRAFVVSDILKKYQDIYHPDYVFWEDYPNIYLIDT